MSSQLQHLFKLNLQMAKAFHDCATNIEADEKKANKKRKEMDTEPTEDPRATKRARVKIATPQDVREFFQAVAASSTLKKDKLQVPTTGENYEQLKDALNEKYSGWAFRSLVNKFYAFKKKPEYAAIWDEEFRREMTKRRGEGSGTGGTSSTQQPPASAQQQHQQTAPSNQRQSGGRNGSNQQQNSGPANPVDPRPTQNQHSRSAQSASQQQNSTQPATAPQTAINQNGTNNAANQQQPVPPHLDMKNSLRSIYDRLIQYSPPRNHRKDQFSFCGKLEAVIESENLTKDEASEWKERASKYERWLVNEGGCAEQAQ